MINGAWYVEPNPCGEITSQQYQADAKKLQIDFFNKHHKNHFRNDDASTHLDEAPFKEKLYQHTSVTIQLNDLQNFNPTCKGLTYFKETELNNMLYNPTSKPRYQGIINRITHIPDHIDNLRKPGKLFHTGLSHSFGLTPVKV